MSHNASLLMSTPLAHTDLARLCHVYAVLIGCVLVVTLSRPPAWLCLPCASVVVGGWGSWHADDQHCLVTTHDPQQAHMA